MAFIMSTEGQQVVSDEGYIPVADVEAYAGDAPEGSCVVGGSSICISADGETDRGLCIS